MLLLAGPFAQRRYAPNSHWEFGAGHHGTIHGVPQYGPASDLDFFWRDIFRIIRLGPQDNGARTRAWRDGLVEKLEARTTALVKARWPEIKILAAGLLARRTLTERQVYRLLGRPAPKRYRWQFVEASRAIHRATEEQVQ